MPSDNSTRDALVSVIKTLQQRIRDHATKRNETRTRTVLIDPVIDGLGWSDPLLSTSEYSIGYGQGLRIVDYALHPTGQKGRPIAFIEAKRLRETLTCDHLNQVLRYASKRNSVRYVGLTNGDRWQFHERLEDGWSLVLDISVRDESAFHCATQLVWFKRLIEGLGDADPEGIGDSGITGQTLYHHLGVESSASPEEIRKGYRRKIRQVHPDVCADENAKEKSQLTIEAYSILRDPTKRSQYDRELAATRRARQETSPPTERPTPPRPPPSPPRYESDSSSAQAGTHSQPDPNRTVDVSTIISWSVSSFALCTAISYLVGFRAAQPILEGFAGTVGAWVVGVPATVAAAMVLFRLPWRRLSLGWLWSGQRYVKRTLIWSCGCIVGCGLLGGLLGYFVGFQTAQPIYDILAVVGTVVIVVVVAAVLILIIFGLSRR